MDYMDDNVYDTRLKEICSNYSIDAGSITTCQL